MWHYYICHMAHARARGEAERLATLLGGRKTLAHAVSEPGDIQDAIRKGLPYATFEILMRVLGIRARELARFLADSHAAKRSEPTLYERRIRELVGHGECLMGILDSYPHPFPLLPPDACAALERAAVSWRKARTMASY